MTIIVIPTNTHFRVEYWKSSQDGQWYFHLKARNNRVVSASEGYKEQRSVFRVLSKLGFEYKQVDDPSHNQWTKTEQPAVFAQVG
jgi:hypothetical protein